MKASELGDLSPRTWIASPRNTVVLPLDDQARSGCARRRARRRLRRRRRRVETGGPACSARRGVRTGRLTARPQTRSTIRASPACGRSTAARCSTFRRATARRRSSSPCTARRQLPREPDGAATAVRRPRRSDPARPKSKGPTWDVATGGFGPDVAAIDRLLDQVFSKYEVDDVAVAASRTAPVVRALARAHERRPVRLGDRLLTRASSRSGSRTAGHACSSRTAPRTRSCRSAGRAVAAFRGPRRRLPGRVPRVQGRPRGARPDRP